MNTSRSSGQNAPPSQHPSNRDTPISSSEYSTPSPRRLHYIRPPNPPSSPSSSGLSSPPPSVDNVPPNAVQPDPTPADIIAACKARMNADLISAFKAPCPPGTTPYITGVGLYTHIEGPALPNEQDLPPQPKFLPVRRPAGSEDSGSMMDEDVRKLWSYLCDVIQDEERVIGKTELGLKELTKRFEGFSVPEGSTTPAQFESGEEGDTVMQEDGEAQAGGEVRPQASAHQTSLGGVLGTLAELPETSADVNMQGTEEVRGRRLPPSTSIYAPDPRRRAR